MSNLDKMKEILDTLKIELQITGRYDSYYEPWIIFKYRGTTLVDDQTTFDNLISGGIKTFEGSAVHLKLDEQPLNKNIIDDNDSKDETKGDD